MSATSDSESESESVTERETHTHSKVKVTTNRWIEKRGRERAVEGCCVMKVEVKVKVQM